MTTRRFTRSTAPRDWLDYRQWHTVSIEGFDDRSKRRFTLLAGAIKDYINGQRFDDDLRNEGIYRETLLRAFNRCITADGNSHLLGWRGLCPGIRIRAPVRRKPLMASGRNKRGGLSGALNLLFRQRSDVAEKFEKYLLANAKRVGGHEARLRHKSAFQKFIELCKADGVKEWQWPLCTRRQGRESIRQYVERFLEARYDDIVATQYGDRAKARSNTSKGFESRLVACRPFDIVEIDEHKCGFIGSIGIPTPDGYRWFPLERLTIILVADRWLRLILGYKVIFRREANTDDVLDALNSAIGNGPTRSYCEGYETESRCSLPSTVGEPFTWCGYNQVLVDNALVHIAAEISGRARSLIGCDFNFGPVRRFERRPVVENIFGVLERLGFRRLQNTVGTSPHDPMRQKPEEVAVSAKLTVQQILKLIEDVIADHNQRNGKGNFGSNPLRRLEAAWRDEDGAGVIFPVLPPLVPGVPGLDVSVVPLTIRGSKARGRRPYFTFEGEAYTGVEMARNWTLLGKQVIGHVNRAAIRELQIYNHAGELIDVAKVMGRWRHTEHSRDMRRHVNALIQEKYLKVGYGECPIHRFVESIKEAALRAPGLSSDVPRGDLGALAGEEQARATRATQAVEHADAMAQDTTSETAGNEEEFLDYSGLTAFGG